MVSNQGIKFKFQKQVQTTTGNENGGLKATDDAIKNDSQLKTIFAKIDKGSTDGKGKNDGVLTDEEIQRFMKELKDAAGKNGKLSKHEAKKFLKSLGIENADPKALYRFIQTVQAKSANIKNCTMDENGDIIINSEDGNTEETIHSDKTSELKTTDENQNVTTQYKNAAGEVYKKEVKNPDGTTTTIEYEMDGDKTKTDAEGNPVVSKETIVNTETNKTTVISYQNGKKVKSEEKDNSTDETTVIEFDEDGNPKTKTVTIGCVEEQYQYVNGKELLKQKIENKGNDTLESITNYEYDSEGNCTKETKNTPTEEKVITFDSNGGKTEVITEKDTDGQLTENVTTNTLNSDGNKLSQTKTVDGTPYSVEYDGEGNTKGVIVQNGESPTAIAKKFGVSVDDLLRVNADSVKTNKKGVKFFNVGDEIKIPGELDADKFVEVQAGRKTSEETRADYAKDEEIREQKRAAARAQEEEYKALGLKNYNGKGNTIKGHYKGGKDQEFTVIGECDNGRKLAKSKDGKTVILAQDGTVLKNDYAKATHAYNAGQGTARADGRGRTVVTGDDGTQYVFSHDGKLLSSEYVSATDKVDNKQANKTVSNTEMTFVKGSDGNIYYFDADGQLITGDARKKLVKAESETAANKIYSAAHGLGTDEEKLAEGVNEIYSPEITAQVNSILKNKGYTGDELTTPIEDLLIDELSRSEVRTHIRTLAQNGAYGNEASTDKALGRNAAREIEYEVHGGILGYTGTAELKDAMGLASTRGARLETEELLKDKIKGSPDEGSNVRTYIAEDGFNAKEVDQFDATWIKNNAYDSEHDQEHRNTVTNRLVFSYNSDESLHIALDSIDSDPESADYKNLDEQAAKANKEKKYEAHYTDQNNVQIYLAGRTANSDGSVDAEHVSACNTLLYKGEKPARIQAEEILYNAQKGDMSAVFDGMDPKIYTEMAELIQNGDVKGCTSIQNAYEQAIKNTTDVNDLANIKANAILSGQVEFTENEIADFCVDLMHRIDENRAEGATQGRSASYTNTADYETEQLKAILQAHPEITEEVKTKVNEGNFSYSVITNSSLAKNSYERTFDTKDDYLEILNNTRYIVDTSVFYDQDGKQITDAAQIKATQEMYMNSLEDMRAYVAELERELKKGIDAEGALSDTANSLSTYSGLGTDRNDAATKYQNAKLLLNQLEAAAQGKLRDSSGNVILLQDLAQEVIDKESELEQTNSDYKSTIETGKMGLVLAPVIVATTVASGGATLLHAGFWTTAAVAGVATGVSEYGMNTIERTTSITGDTAETRERDRNSAITDGVSAAIGVGQMKPISEIAKTTSAVVRGATRFSATVASDVGVGAAGEYVQTGNVTAEGVAMNMAFSGTGNLIGIRSLAKNEGMPGAGNHHSPDQEIVNREVRNEQKSADKSAGYNRKRRQEADKSAVDMDPEQNVVTPEQQAAYDREMAFKPVDEADRPAYEAHQEQVAKDYAEAHRIENMADEKSAAALKKAKENSDGTSADPKPADAPEPKPAVNPETQAKVQTLENEIKGLEGSIQQKEKQIFGAKKFGKNTDKLEAELAGLNDKLTAKKTELETLKNSAAKTPVSLETVKESKTAPDASAAKEKPAADGIENAQHTANDGNVSDANAPKNTDGAPKAGHAENAKAAAEDVKKSVNDIPESGIPVQNKQLWNNCKTKIDAILIDLQRLKPDLALISKKMSALFNDIEYIAMTASSKVKAQLKALKTKIENMFEEIDRYISPEWHLTTEEYTRINEKITSATKQSDLDETRMLLDSMPECPDKYELQNLIDTKQSEISAAEHANNVKAEPAQAHEAEISARKSDEVEVISEKSAAKRSEKADLDVIKAEVVSEHAAAVPKNSNADKKLVSNERQKVSQQDSVRLGDHVDINFADLQAKFDAMHDGDSFIIGRTVTGVDDIKINNQYISGQHLKVEKINGEIYITDLSSTTGTVLNTTKPNYAARYKPEISQKDAKSSHYYDLCDTYYKEIRKAKYTDESSVRNNISNDDLAYNDSLCAQTENVAIVNANGWSWRYPTGKNKLSEGAAVDRISLNVVADKNLLNELDQLLNKGSYVNKQGQTIKIDVPKCQYKTSQSLKKWTERHDPITMYFAEKVSPDLENAIAEITEKYARVPVNGKALMNSIEGKPWIAHESYVRKEDAKALYDKACKIDKELGEGLKSSLGGNKTDNQWNCSTGRYAAAQRVFDEYMLSRPDLDIVGVHL